MNVLVVIFGGVDTEFLKRFPSPNLTQEEWGPVAVDELHDERDVASQITAQLITGETWRENGVGDRKRQFITYRSSRLRKLEEGMLSNVSKGLVKRRRLYHLLGWADVTEREFVAEDLTCPSLFDRIPGSAAVYVPAYNPEPSWALDRNIFNPRRYPGLGVAEAVDLLDKNFSWRRQRFLEALQQPPKPLLMAQFQYIDSLQHLYLDYVTPPQEEMVEAGYRMIDSLAQEIKAKADGRYDRVLFVSDNGAALKDGYQPTHHNRPFYSVDAVVGLERPNLRDFHDLILEWVAAAPNQGKITDA
jgi:hypothetical protein